ncbi:MAG TPA: c-type cytochrome [Candidatus Methylomirabilis sp.]|nr:c-type cytochrome [Candidatus Methylomirabilis sp.]
MRYVSRRGVICLLAAGGLAAILAWEFLTPSKVEHPVVGGAPDGRALFAAHCAECHGDTGKGDGPGAKIVRTPMTDFTNAAAMANRDDHFLAEIIKKGGSQFGRSNAMPAWGMKLSDEEIRALVVFIRSQAHPNSAVSSEKK